MKNIVSVFDLVSAFRESYQFVWRSRLSLLQACLWPFVVKVALFFVVLFMGLEDEYLRQGLIFVPSYFLEGLFIAYALRRAVYGESLDALPKADMLAAAQVYTLIKLLSALIVGLVFSSADPASAPAQATDARSFLLAVSVLVFICWSFRYLWIYVPLALGFSMLRFLKQIPGFSGSLRLMGLWFLIFVPVFMITILFYDVIGLAFPGQSIEEGSLVYKASFGFVQAGLELFGALIASIAVGHAFMQTIRRHSS